MDSLFFVYSFAHPINSYKQRKKEKRYRKEQKKLEKKKSYYFSSKMNAEIDKDALIYIAAHSATDEKMEFKNSVKMTNQDSKKSAVKESISATERILELEAELVDEKCRRQLMEPEIADLNEIIKDLQLELQLDKNEKCHRLGQLETENRLLKDTVKTLELANEKCSSLVYVEPAEINDLKETIECLELELQFVYEEKVNEKTLLKETIKALESQLANQKCCCWLLRDYLEPEIRDFKEMIQCLELELKIANEENDNEKALLQKTIKTLESQLANEKCPRCS